MMRGSGQIFLLVYSVFTFGLHLRRFSSCFGFQYLQRSGTVKTVPYRMFWGALLTCKISVGRNGIYGKAYPAARGLCARRRVSEARLTGNARQFAKQTRSCSCKTHWVLHCSPSHFRKLKCDLLARNPATGAAPRLLGRRRMPSSRRGFALLRIYIPAASRTPFVGG